MSRIVGTSNEINKSVTDELNFQRSISTQPSIIHVILLNRTFRILVALGIFSMIVPLFDYFYFYCTDDAEHKIDDSGICSHYPIYQIPCGAVNENISESECRASACCFSSTTGCYHFLPSKYQLKLKADRPWHPNEVLSPTKEISPLKTRLYDSMKLDIVEENDEVLSIILWNPSLVSHDTTSNNSSRNSKYHWKVFTPELFIEVRRKINNEAIFSTTRGALIASKSYFEWTIFLGSSNLQLMGFDTTDLREGHRILINNVHSSVIPYVVAYDSQSKYYHGLHFESIHSPTEIQIQKSNTIIIKQYYSASFSIKLFTGPTYFDVYKQIKSFSSAPYIPADFWPFGVHYCRTNQKYNKTSTEIELNQLLMNSKSIPFDSHCIDSEYSALLLSQNYTGDEYEELIQKLQSRNKKLLLHMSMNAIEIQTDDEKRRYKEAFKSDEIFLKDSDGKTNFIGTYSESRKVFYLDYITKSSKIAELLMSQKQQQYYSASNFFKLSNGFFLYRNFPYDDTVNKTFSYLSENFKFLPFGNFEYEIEKLIPLNVQLQTGESLIHQLNKYGREQIEVFQKTLNDDGKKFCIADSYRETSNGWCGMLMRVEKPTWTNFQSTINKSVFYSLIGMSFYGAEVCGSMGTIDDNNIDNVNENLCIRWYQFAIFQPLFYVNSNRIPTKFTKYAERAMVHAVRTRYALLNYMRTCMLMDIPLLRPLIHVYPEINIELISNSHQLMYGDSLMIAPIVEPLTVQVNLYFPEKFYELWSGLEMPQNSTHFSIVMHDIPIFIRAGHIIALNLAHESVSAEEARLQPYLLIVALSCDENLSCYSSGSMNIVGGSRNGVEFKFEASESHLNITVITVENPSETRNEICGPEPFASSEFRFAKIYGLGDFKETYRNDYLSLDLNICDADWNKIFTISIQKWKE